VVGAGGHCYYVGASGTTLVGNTAAGCAGSGFFVQAAEDRLESNRATGAGANGFSVYGTQGDGVTPATDNVLQGNVAQFNAAQGIAILAGATLTQVIGNLATTNRTDFCDEGTSTSASGNTFRTTGPCAVVH
jgi:hypothetical protein